MRAIIYATIVFFFGGGTAFADVTFCNHTTSKLQLAIAHPVTQPYVTKEISAWHTLNAGDCTKMLLGNFVGDTIYYYILYADGVRQWQTKGADSTYPFCVQEQAFIRHGTYSALQTDCPQGWVTREFFAVVVDVPDQTLGLYD